MKGVQKAERAAPLLEGRAASNGSGIVGVDADWRIADADDGRTAGIVGVWPAALASASLRRRAVGGLEPNVWPAALASASLLRRRATGLTLLWDRVSVAINVLMRGPGEAGAAAGAADGPGLSSRRSDFSAQLHLARGGRVLWCSAELSTLIHGASQELKNGGGLC